MNLIKPVFRNSTTLLGRLVTIATTTAIVCLASFSLTTAQKQSVAGACSSSQCDTGFRPELNGWATRNMRSDFTRNTGFELLNYGCYGMTRLAQVAFEPEKRDKPGLYQQSRSMDALERQIYAMTAHALMERDSRTSLSPQFSQLVSNSDVFAEIRETIVRTGKPQVLAIRSSDPNKLVGHAVLVTGFEQHGDSVKLAIYDPNLLLGNTKRWVEYTVGSREFSVRSSDRADRLYKTYNMARFDRDEEQTQVIKTAKMLLRDVEEDGRLDTHLDAFTIKYIGSLGRRRTIAVTKDKKLGGVSVYYDPELLEGEGDDENVGRMVEDLTRDLWEGRSNIALRLGGGREESFSTLSLRSWLASGSKTLGELTRVRGFVRKDDDILLIGQVEPGRPKLNGDLLVVALKAIYREGRSPGVSLDIDRSDPYGAQKPRVVDMPRDLISTEYVRTMLDADYLMKRIDLGEIKPPIEGYKGFFELLKADPQQGLGLRRSWFTPVQLPVGDVFENGSAVLFESDVQVLTEKEKKNNEDLPKITNREETRIDVAAARNMTRYFRDMEQRYDDYYKLHQLFDVSKLSAILRQKGVRSQLLDDIANRTSPVVVRRDETGKEIPMLSSYRGIGPKVIEGASIAIGGGVDLSMHFTPSSFVRSEKLGDILSGERNLTLESSIPINENAGVVLLASSAANDCLEKRFADCARKSQDALNDLPGGEFERRVRMMWALALFESGETKQATAQADLLVGQAPESPLSLALRASFRLYSDDIAGAKLDVDSAAKLHPNDTIWALKAEIDLCSLDLVSAQKDIEQLAAFDPVGDDVLRFRAMLKAISRLPRAIAAQWVRRELGRPIPIARAHLRARAAIGNGDFKTAIASFQQAFDLASASPTMKSGRGFLREEALFWIAMTKAQAARAEPDDPPIMAPRLFPDSQPRPKPQPENGLAEAMKLIKMHPEWATPHLAEAFCRMMSKTVAFDKLKIGSLLSKAFAADISRDPLALPLLTAFGYAESVRRYFYTMAYMRSLEKGSDGTMFLKPIAADKGLEGKLAENLIVMDSVRDENGFKSTLANIRGFADEVLRSTPKPDLGANTLWFVFVNGYASFEDKAGNAAASLNASRRQFAYSPDDAPSEVLNMVAFLRAKMIERRSSIAERKFEDDPEIKKLFAETSAGGRPLERIGRRAGQLVEAELAKPWTNATALNRELYGLLFAGTPLRLQLAALDRDNGHPGRTQAEVDALEATKAAIRRRYNDHIVALGPRLELLLKGDRTITDRRTVERLADLIAILDFQLDNETKKKLRSVVAAMGASTTLREVLRD